MNELIRISNIAVGNAQIQTVNARELHMFLGVGKDFSTWIKGRVKQYGFAENLDFVTFESAPPDGGAGNRGLRIEYALSLSMAKELAMVERNEQGKKARLYFIECERRAAQAPAPQFTQLEALRMAVDGWEKAEAMLHESQAHVEKLVDMVVEMEPEVEAYRRLAGLNGSFCLTDAAKALKISPRWFVNWLDKSKWIYRRRMVAEWTANQTKIDAGYLTTISTLDAANILRPQCRVTPKGMAKLSKVFAELVKNS